MLDIVPSVNNEHAQKGQREPGKYLLNSGVTQVYRLQMRQ